MDDSSSSSRWGNRERGDHFSRLARWFQMHLKRQIHEHRNQEDTHPSCTCCWLDHKRLHLIAWQMFSSSLLFEARGPPIISLCHQMFREAISVPRMLRVKWITWIQSMLFHHSSLVIVVSSKVSVIFYPFTTPSSCGPVEWYSLTPRVTNVNGRADLFIIRSQKNTHAFLSNYRGVSI